MLKRYAEYMHAHRVQADGAMRASDNWQKGIPQDQYRKSGWRHWVDVWTIHRGWRAFDPKDGHEITLTEALCGVLFNASGLLHEHLKSKDPCSHCQYRDSGCDLGLSPDICGDSMKGLA